MASGSAGGTLPKEFHNLFRFGVVGHLSDGQLLQRFIAGRDGGDQAAFTELVERHGPMVMHVCREVLSNTHDAQDAFQATFLVLARKANSVREVNSLGSWLHGVAYRVALRARSSTNRRRIHESKVAAVRAAETQLEKADPESWRELHEEVARLPRHYREPVVLCYLEGLSTEEAALRIGCPKGTVFSRLSRARERLRGRLEGRGLALPAALLTTGLTRPVRTALPTGLLNSTIQSLMEFTGRLPTEAASASARAAIMARGMLSAMTISKLTFLGSVGLAGILALGGSQTYGWISGLDGSRDPIRTIPTDDDTQTALSRSVEKLQSDLEETARRNTEMRKELQDIRGHLKTLRPAPEQTLAQNVVTRLSGEPAQSVARLAEVLKRHPARRIPKEGNRVRLYMMDLVEGGTTLIADEPEPGFNWCNSPVWSHDGTRILFGTWPLPGFELCHIKAIEVHDGRPICIDLGAGNSPTLSPDDKRIAYALEPRSPTKENAGMWVMRADGSERRRLSDYYGAPNWSPDGHEFLINDWSIPTKSMVINLETKEGNIVAIPGHHIFSWPSWAGPGTLISALATEHEGNSIALIDVRRPAEARIIEVLWKRSNELDVTPRWPAYQPKARRCFFVGEEPTKRTLFSVQRGESGRAKPLEAGYNSRAGGLSFSPDGRYLLFCANRPDRR